MKSAREVQQLRNNGRPVDLQLVDQLVLDYFKLYEAADRLKNVLQEMHDYLEQRGVKDE